MGKRKEIIITQPTGTASTSYVHTSNTTHGEVLDMFIAIACYEYECDEYYLYDWCIDMNTNAKLFDPECYYNDDSNWTSPDTYYGDGMTHGDVGHYF